MYEREFKCNICQKRYALLSDLKGHYKERHSVEEKRHKCALCDYSSDKRSDVTRHQDRKHQEEKPSTSSEGHNKFTTRVERDAPLPPKVRRLNASRADNSSGWPILDDILGSPTPNFKDTGGKLKSDLPPTPYVTPEREDTEETAPDIVHYTNKELPCNGFLRERILTKVMADGRVKVTVERYGDIPSKSGRNTGTNAENKKPRNEPEKNSAKGEKNKMDGKDGSQ